jgi:hypothetical protein
MIPFLVALLIAPLPFVGLVVPLVALARTTRG